MSGVQSEHYPRSPGGTGEVCELVSQGIVKLGLVPTDKMLADFLTKPLELGPFLRCRAAFFNEEAGRSTGSSPSTA